MLSFKEHKEINEQIIEEGIASGLFAVGMGIYLMLQAHSILKNGAPLEKGVVERLKYFGKAHKRVQELRKMDKSAIDDLHNQTINLLQAMKKAGATSGTLWSTVTKLDTQIEDIERMIDKKKTDETVLSALHASLKHFDQTINTMTNRYKRVIS